MVYGLAAAAWDPLLVKGGGISYVQYETWTVGIQSNTGSLSSFFCAWKLDSCDGEKGIFLTIDVAEAVKTDI